MTSRSPLCMYTMRNSEISWPFSFSWFCGGVFTHSANRLQEHAQDLQITDYRVIDGSQNWCSSILYWKHCTLSRFFHPHLPVFILFLYAPECTFSHPVYAAALLFLVVYSGGGEWKWSRVVLVCFLEHAFGIKLLISQPSVRVEEAMQGTR